MDFINSLHQAHKEIKEALHQKKYITVQNMLGECQEFAVILGENIEKLEGEGCITISHVEAYCEILFHVFEEINNGQCNENRIYKILKKHLLNVENSVKNDIAIKKEIAFFPYKASMWDSLESVYLAAKEDPGCDVYCVPIPYYDLNGDRSFGTMHYEGSEYPDNIEIVNWEDYNFEERKPDVIYIHNPYDNFNLVTSVHPRFYSSNLKKYTDTLVYIPYYSTSGKMNEAQSLCPAYIYADYIVIQAPEFRSCFDASIPERKFLPFGSPKFDRIIKKCQNPPVTTIEWREKIAGRKVYFYNTSISGMLADTEAFLKKMLYVFQCFEGREDVCLLWRPHPLLEATFDSMRPHYHHVYDALKQMFLDRNFGILDETPDIADAISLSDAYIGDPGTSITSLFGIVGKPLFILDNRINSRTEKDDWRRALDIRFNFFENDKFVITQGDKLYLSDAGKYEYRYFCDLSGHTRDNHYSLVYEIDDKYYVCSDTAQNILMVGEKGVEKTIKLDEKTKDQNAFIWAWKYEKYLLLIPLNYPAIVRYDTVTGKINYYDEHIDVFIKYKNGQNIVGNSLVYQDALYIASPTDNYVYKLNIESGQIQIIELSIQSRCGCFQLSEYKDEIWLLPYEGRVIVRWNPLTGKIREYSDFPDEFTCVNPANGCEGPAFNNPAFYEDYMYLAPGWANMYLKLNINTGEFTAWQPQFDDDKAGHGIFTNEKSTFLYKHPNESRNVFKLYSYTKQKLYSIDNIETAECKEIVFKFDVEELRDHEPGFCECSETLRYACVENYFNSLEAFLDGEIAGYKFDKSRQIAAYRAIAANYDGNCGQKTHEFIMKQ